MPAGFVERVSTCPVLDAPLWRPQARDRWAEVAGVRAGEDAVARLHGVRVQRPRAPSVGRRSGTAGGLAELQR